MLATFGSQTWMVAFCERNTAWLFAPSASVLAEPLNVASNLLILLTAAALARRAVALRDSAIVPLSVRALIALIAVVAFASIVYHLAPMKWSWVLDVQSVHVFGLWFAACFARWMLGLPWRQALFAIPLFGIFGLTISEVVPDFGLDLARFLPAAIALGVLTVWLARRDDPAWRSFGGAAVVFALGLGFHHGDTALCGPIPTGTHFLWHLCSGVMLFLITRELLERAVAAERQHERRRVEPRALVAASLGLTQQEAALLHRRRNQI